MKINKRNDDFTVSKSQPDETILSFEEGNIIVFMSFFMTSELTDVIDKLNQVLNEKDKPNKP